MIKKIGKGLGATAGFILSMPITAAGHVTGIKTLKDAGSATYHATKKTGAVAGKVVDGSFNVARGIWGSDESRRRGGYREICGAMKETISGIAGGIKYTTVSGLKVGRGVVRRDGNSLREGASNLFKVGIVGAVGMTVADMTGAVDINGDATPVYTLPVSDMYTSLDEFMPSLAVNEIPGVYNGIATSSSTGELIEVGCMENTNHIEDPHRSGVMEQLFLRRYGLTEGPDGYEIHHVVPLSEGGPDHPDNMVLVTEAEHQKITLAHRNFYRW